MVQLSKPFMTTRKIIALTIQTFVGKVMSLLFNTLSKPIISGINPKYSLEELMLKLKLQYFGQLM